MALNNVYGDNWNNIDVEKLLFLANCVVEDGRIKRHVLVNKKKNTVQVGGYFFKFGAKKFSQKETLFSIPADMPDFTDYKGLFSSYKEI